MEVAYREIVKDMKGVGVDTTGTDEPIVRVENWTFSEDLLVSNLLNAALFTVVIVVLRILFER
jgi:hypothetical protein